MIVETTVTIGSLTLTVRELTAGEIRARLMLQSVTPPSDALHELLFGEFRVADLLDFSDLTAEQVETLKPSEMRALWQRIREVNADFFAMLGRLMALPAPAASQATPSETQPAASSSPPLH